MAEESFLHVPGDQFIIEPAIQFPVARADPDRAFYIGGNARDHAVRRQFIGQRAYPLPVRPGDEQSILGNTPQDMVGIFADRLERNQGTGAVVQAFQPHGAAGDPVQSSAGGAGPDVALPVFRKA
jgi:hypothetical protein